MCPLVGSAVSLSDDTGTARLVFQGIRSLLRTPERSLWAYFGSLWWPQRLASVEDFPALNHQVAAWTRKMATEVALLASRTLLHINHAVSLFLLLLLRDICRAGGGRQP